MPIDWIYRDAVPVETSATSLLSTGTTLPDDVQGPPPPPTPPSFANLVMLGSAEQIDQFQPSYYQFESTGLCRAQDPTECKFTLCQIAVTWWIAESCCSALLYGSCAHRH